MRSDEPGLARKQNRMNGVNRFLVGCDCNRRTLASIEAAGFTVEHVEHATLNGVPTFVSPPDRRDSRVAELAPSDSPAQSPTISTR